MKIGGRSLRYIQRVPCANDCFRPKFSRRPHAALHCFSTHLCPCQLGSDVIVCPKGQRIEEI